MSDRRDQPAASTKSYEQRVERWIDWTQRAWSDCPLSLYDEHQKLGEIAVGEMLGEISRLQAALAEIRDFDESEWHNGDGFLAVSFLCAKANEALNG